MSKREVAGERSAVAFLSNIPLSIRPTLNQLQDIADEAELRAVTLEWMSGPLWRRPSRQKVRTLKQVAGDLRRKAERLLEDPSLQSTGAVSR